MKSVAWRQRNSWAASLRKSPFLVSKFFIGACFIIEVWLSKPVLSQVAMGLIPILNDKSLYIAIGILGATVMPHNLYLHSALVQTRQIGVTNLDRKVACKFNFSPRGSFSVGTPVFRMR